MSDTRWCGWPHPNNNLRHPLCVDIQRLDDRLSGLEGAGSKDAGLHLRHCTVIDSCVRDTSTRENIHNLDDQILSLDLHRFTPANLRRKVEVEP